MWKTNDRISRAIASGGDAEGLHESYFGDPEESDDYELADPKNFPTHWTPISPVPDQ